MDKTKNNTRTNKKISFYLLRGLIIVLALLFVWACIDFLTPFGGNIRFYSKWTQCKQRPVVVAVMFEEGIRYYERFPDFNISFTTQNFFCSPREAELAGYSADKNNYYFPHLTNNEIEHLEMRNAGYTP